MNHPTKPSATKEINPVMDAFTLHDQEGIPLTVSMSLAKERGLEINCAAFACDALAAGWSLDKIMATIGAARNDNNMPWYEGEFREKMSGLYMVSGGPSLGPSIFLAMKQFLVDAPKRVAK